MKIANSKVQLMLILIVLVIALGGIRLNNIYSKNNDYTNDLIATVNGESIYYSDVIRIVNNDYLDIILRELIDDVLVIQEAKRLSLLESNSMEIRDKKSLQQNIEIRQLIHELVKIRATDEEVEQYYNTRLVGHVEIRGKKIWKIDVPHQVAVELMIAFKNTGNIEEALQFLSIPQESIEIKDVLVEDKSEYIKYINFEENEIDMIMDGEDHFVIYVEENLIEDALHWPEDKERILDLYVFDNTGKETIRLLNDLRSLSSIEIHETTNK